MNNKTVEALNLYLGTFIKLHNTNYDTTVTHSKTNNDNTKQTMLLIFAFANTVAMAMHTVGLDLTPTA